MKLIDKKIIGSALIMLSAIGLSACSGHGNPLLKSKKEDVIKSIRAAEVASARSLNIQFVGSIYAQCMNGYGSDNKEKCDKLFKKMSDFFKSDKNISSKLRSVTVDDLKSESLWNKIELPYMNSIG